MTTPTDLMALVDKYASVKAAVGGQSALHGGVGVGLLGAQKDARDALEQAIQNLPCFLENTEADDSSSSEQAARVESVSTPRPPASPEPIEPDDIREGDSIRLEWVTSQDGTPMAMEYVAPHSGTAMKKRLSGNELQTASWFLLDRPSPAVELPTEPTLGWIASKYGGTVLGTWERYTSTRASHAGEVSALVRERDVPLEYVQSFTPAVAVPKAALDELREMWVGDLGCDRQRDWVEYGARLFTTTRDFLAAVDAANAGNPA